MKVSNSRNNLYNKTYKKAGGRNNKRHLTADYSKLCLNKTTNKSNTKPHTNSSKNLSHFKERQNEVTHEKMLKSELQKFRAEVENRFRNSEANSTYIFPRINNLKEDDKPSIHLAVDCSLKVISISHYNFCNYKRDNVSC